MDDDPDMLPAHSALGASSMERWKNCPASFGLSRKHRHRLPTIHAATGTVAHTLVEQTLAAASNGVDITQTLRDHLGITTNVDGHAVTVDAEMIEGVMMMADYLVQRTAELGTSPVIEQTVFMDHWFEHKEPPPVRMFGRADAQFLTDDLLELVDYKNGAGVLVEVIDNDQLMYYTAGVLAGIMRRVKALGELPARVRLTVVQPNARTPEKIRTYELTSLDVLLWVDEVLIPAVRRIQAPDPAFAPGKWCGFCPVAHACPRLFKDAQMAAKVDFDDSAEGTELAGHLELAERVTLWAEAVRGFALERVKGGLIIPGWAEVPTRPRRTWDSPDTVQDILTRSGVNDVVETKLRSPAQIEKLVKRTPRIWDLVAPHVQSKSSGTKLTRTGDGAEDDNLFDMIDT